MTIVLVMTTLILSAQTFSFKSVVTNKYDYSKGSADLTVTYVIDSISIEVNDSIVVLNANYTCIDRGNVHNNIHYSKVYHKDESTLYCKVWSNFIKDDFSSLETTNIIFDGNCFSIALPYSEDYCDSHNFENIKICIE